MDARRPRDLSLSTDLADRHPGTMARAQARRAVEESPIRSILARLMGVHTSERAWRLGAEGEELVGVQRTKLAAADLRWRDLAGIPVVHGDADTDHLDSDEVIPRHGHYCATVAAVVVVGEDVRDTAVRTMEQSREVDAL
jgi:hypothetical protein